jgi:hypothetical protein
MDVSNTRKRKAEQIENCIKKIRPSSTSDTEMLFSKPLTKEDLDVAYRTISPDDPTQVNLKKCLTAFESNATKPEKVVIFWVTIAVVTKMRNEGFMDKDSEMKTYEFLVRDVLPTFS